LILQRAQAARAGTIRDINRQIALNYVREREPISRAEIASETALQRSTVSTMCLPISSPPPPPPPLEKVAGRKFFSTEARKVLTVHENCITYLLRSVKQQTFK
jgi:hypothetical protein